MKLRHIVLTRLGIGMNRRSFYRRHIALMVATTLPGMARQTCSDFEWVIAVDVKIDEESWAELTEALAPYSHFRAIKLDPFEDGLAPLLSHVLQGPVNADRLAVSRLDDDDALTLDFVERVRACALKPGARTPMSIAFHRGLQVDPTTGQFAPSVAPSIAIGLTIVSAAADPLDIYGTNHTKLHAAIEARGGEIALLDDGAVDWLHVRSVLSDSGEALSRRREISRGVRELKLAKPTFTMDQSERVAEILAGGLSRCGLDLEWMSIVKGLRESRPDEAPDISWEPALRRTQIKSALLRVARQAREKGRDADALEWAFYMA